MKEFYEFLNSQSSERLFWGAVLTIVAISTVFTGIASIIRAFKNSHVEKDEEDED